MAAKLPKSISIYINFSCNMILSFLLITYKNTVPLQPPPPYWLSVKRRVFIPIPAVLALTPVGLSWECGRLVFHIEGKWTSFLSPPRVLEIWCRRNRILTLRPCGEKLYRILRQLQLDAKSIWIDHSWPSRLLTRLWPLGGLGVLNGLLVVFNSRGDGLQTWE